MNKKSIIGILAVVAVVIVLLTLSVNHFSRPSAPVEPEQTLGGFSGGATQGVTANTNGVGTGYDYALVTRAGTIPLGSNQGAWCNSGAKGVGKTVYVDLARITTSATASSTMKVYVATSTSATIASDFNAPFGTLINNFPIATSSLATTTGSTDYRRTGFGIIAVPVGQCVVTQIQAAAATCPTTGGSCESATSTNRGFTLDWMLEGYYKP